MKSTQVMNGSHGQIYWGNELVAEAKSFEAKITSDREDINFLGSLATDSKLKGYSGEWTINGYHVFSRAKAIADAVKKGQDIRFKIVGKLADPDANGSETIVLNNCWCNDLTLLKFEASSVVEDEFSGGFTDFYYMDSVENK